jgi:hypothetical protein
MRVKYCKPFKTGGPSSNSWQIVIPSHIVKQYGIDESTGFIVEHDDHKIVLSYANVEYKK